MICVLCLLLTNSVYEYVWQELPSPGIRTHAHGVVYDPVNDLFFITGGDSSNFEDSDFMDICLEFDPKTNTWDTKQPMPTGRGRHYATYRKGYMHVLCGKDAYGNHLNSHEVYDISSDSWETAASAPLTVARPSAVTWKDSLVYLMGGYDVSHTARTEVYVYYPETNSWDSATFLPRRLHCGAVEIKGDSIFIFGGADGSSYYSRILIGEINPADPTEINWFWGESLPMASNGANGLAIKNNIAYMIGGDFDDGTNEAWQYDIQNETWESLPDYPTSIIHRGDFAQRRDGPDSLGIFYCFMGDTAVSSTHYPTEECFRLVVTQNDAGMYAINSPISDTTIGALVQVNGTVKNYGSNAYSFTTFVNIFDPDYLIAFSDSMEVTDLPPSDTLNIDFGSFQPTKNGTYTVEMFTYASDDTYPFNDSLTTTFNSSDYYWESIPSSGIRAYAHTVVYDPAGDLFFIIGGDSTGDGTNMDICLEFDPKTNMWDTKEPMYTAKRGHSATYRNGSIHVLCGVDNYENRITHHEIYDIGSNSWDLAAPAPIPVSRPGVVTWRDSLIYFIGGFVSSYNARTEVYYYNPPTDSWYSATPLPRPFHAGGVKIKGDSIFIVGGGDGSTGYSSILLGEINPADPAEITWSWGNSLPMSGNYNNGFAIKNNNLYLIGGAFNMETKNAWVYDLKNENWTSLPDYPIDCISRGDFVERREGVDSSGVIYSFMGDTSKYSTKEPTDECFKLTRVSSSGIDGEEKNSVTLNGSITLNDDIVINCSISERCDLKIYMYDVLGRQVFSQVERNISTGSHRFTINEDFKNGIYFIRIEAGATTENVKVILLR